jgi:hypothetical protein
MNLTIKNASEQQIYASMFGINSDCEWVLYNFSSNTLDVCVTGSTVAMDYMFPMTGDIFISDVPQLASGIVLFSYNQLPNDFAVVPDGNGIATVQSPSFLPNTLDYDTVFNVVEFTYTGTTAGGAPAVWIDITNVDFFSTPIQLILSGTNPSGAYLESKGSMKSGRDSVFADFIKETEGTVFSELVVTGGSFGSGNVRILGPQHGISAGVIPTSYWDSYVAAMWKLYATDVLTVTASSYGTYTGNTTPGQLIMTNVSDSTDVHVFQEPGPDLAADIFGCSGTLAAPNDARGAIAAVIGAAINRSTILENPNQPDCEVSDYYQLTGSTNLYASVLHKFYMDGTTYAFPFDDVCNGSSTLSCTTPEAATIILSTFDDIC